ncbi:MAG: WD40/YVTN/BNR-like repeat-containing protein [Bacteroidia bacterium]
MKIIIHYFFAFFLLFFSCNESIDKEISPKNTEERLEDVFFVNENLGFAVGGKRYEKDVCLKTTDGGKTWTQQDLGIGKILFSVNFKDENVGFITGLDGKVMKTSDGGNTWVMKQTDWKPIRALAFLPDNEILAVGGDAYGFGIFFRSTDGGDSWKMQDTTKYEMRDVQFTNDSTGYACGYGTIVKSTDKGHTWKFLDIKDEFFSALDFPSENIGYAVGRTGTIAKTTDAGKTWKILRNGNNILQTRHFFNDVKFVNENTGYLVGDKGVFWKTTDGGKNWKPFEKDTKLRYYGIHLLKEGKGFIVGEEGRIEKFEE